MQLYIRRKNFYPPSRVSDYYAIVVSQVRAEAQSAAYRTLDSGDFLTDEERDVLRWGRNATGTSPKRVSQGGMTKEIYREATAIECLVRI
jgi:ribonuclease-3 family protein